MLGRCVCYCSVNGLPGRRGGVAGVMAPAVLSTATGEDMAAETQSSARRRISDQVYDHILRAIIESRFRPGQRLSVPDLADELDVSQMPVRQAIDRLSEEGLVDVRPRSGSFVTQADERDIAETFDIRRALDLLAAETAVEHVCESDISELEDLIQRMDRAAATGGEGMQAHDRLNWEFHLFIVRLSGNERLYEMYDQLNAHLKIASVHVSNRDWAARVPLAQEEHREMVEALRCRSASGLGGVLTRHVERAKVALIEDVRSARNGRPNRSR